jgi:hypothetical protein
MQPVSENLTSLQTRKITHPNFITQSLYLNSRPWSRLCTVLAIIPGITDANGELFAIAIERNR